MQQSKGLQHFRNFSESVVIQDSMLFVCFFNSLCIWKNFNRFSSFIILSGIFTKSGSFSFRLKYFWKRCSWPGMMMYSPNNTDRISDHQCKLCVTQWAAALGHMPRNNEVVGSIPGYRHCSALIKRPPRVSYLYRFLLQKNG